MTLQQRDPLVSVIIPTYNRSGLLRQTVESVLAQTYPAIEVIVVDDGSTDDTPAVMAEYAGRIVYLRKPNGGGTAARNTGLAAARGAFFNFLDHDDLLLPTKIERQLEMMHARPAVGLVHCGFYRIDREGRSIDKVNYLPEGDVRNEIVCGCFLWSGAPLIRREVIEHVGHFDEAAWSSDANLWLRIALAGYEFGCVQEPLGCYRILPDSSMADVERTERMDMRTLDQVFADPRLPTTALARKNEAYFNQRFWLSCRYYTNQRWEDGQRNLEEALRLRPELLTRGYELMQLFCANALDPRVADPVAFVYHLYRHLPPRVAAITRPYRRSLLSWVYAGMALRNYAYGKIDAAKQQLATALAFDPGISARANDFAAALTDFALRLPVNPETYIATVLQNLPPAGRSLARVRGQVLSAVSITAAFRDYQSQKHHLVPRHVLTALRHRPGLLVNRGVGSIFVRSLLRRYV